MEGSIRRLVHTGTLEDFLLSKPLKDGTGSTKSIRPQWRLVEVKHRVIAAAL
jgi:hypothetical protein